MSNPYTKLEEARQRAEARFNLPKPSEVNSYDNVLVTGTDILEKDIHYDVTANSATDNISDAGHSVMGGLARTGDQLVGLGGLVYGTVKYGITGSEQDIADTVNTARTYTKSAVDYWNAGKSNEYHQMMSELSQIEHDKDLSELDKFKKSLGVYVKNPMQSGFQAVESLTNTASSLALTGGLGRVAGVAGKPVQVASTGVLGAGAYTTEASDAGEVGNKTLGYALGYGALSGVINSNNRTVESLLMNGLKGNTLKNVGINTAVEAGTEMADEVSLRILRNHENNREITQGTGSASAGGLALGAYSGAIANVPTLVGSTVSASQTLKNKAQEAIQERLDPYEYNTHSDINHAKYDPVRVHDELTKQLNTGDLSADEVKETINKRHQLVTDLSQRTLDLQEQLENETNETKQQELQSQLDNFKSIMSELKLKQQAIEQSESMANSVEAERFIERIKAKQTEVNDTAIFNQLLNQKDMKLGGELLYLLNSKFGLNLTDKPVTINGRKYQENELLGIVAMTPTEFEENKGKYFKVDNNYFAEINGGMGQVVVLDDPNQAHQLVENFSKYKDSLNQSNVQTQSQPSSQVSRYAHSNQVTKNPNVGLQVGIMGDYMAGGKKGMQTGAGSGDHFDIVVWSGGTGKNSNPKTYFDRFMVASGITLAESLNKNKVTSDQDYGSPRTYRKGIHYGVDIDPRNGRALYVNPKYDVVDVKLGKDVKAGKGKYAYSGIGNYALVTFSDGVTLRIGHMDDNGAKQLASIYGKGNVNSQSNTQSKSNYSINDLQNATIKQLPNGKWTSDDPIIARMIAIESGGDASAWRTNPNGKKSIYRGLLQIDSNNKQDYNAKNYDDAQENFELARKVLVRNYQALNKENIPVTASTLYLTHNQGLHGLKQIYKVATGQLPESVLGSGEGSIRYNMDNNGGKGKTAKQFLDYWESKLEEQYNSIAKANGFNPIGLSNVVTTGDENITPVNNSALDSLNQQLQDMDSGQQEVQEQSQGANTVPLSEEEQFTVDSIMARASTLPADTLDRLIDSGILSDEQVSELRQLSKVKRLQAELNTFDDVTNEVIHGRKGNTVQESHLGINDYSMILNSAIQRGDLETVNKTMSYLDRFSRNAVSKANALRQALSMRPSASNPLMIVADKQGNWSVKSGSRKGNDALYQAGALDVLIPNNANIQQMHQRIFEQASVRGVYDKYMDYITDLQKQGYLTKSNLNNTPVTDVVNNIQLPTVNTQEQVQSTQANVNYVPVVSNLNTNPSGKPKVVQDKGNMRSIKFNTIKDYVPSENEVWVGNGYAYDNGKHRANKSLSILTDDLTLADGSKAQGRLFNGDAIFESGALGNPYSKGLSNAWQAKDRQDEIVKYTDLVKHLATSTKNNRFTFLEDISRLRGKKLVTDEYHKEEAMFLDYLVNQMPQAMFDKIQSIPDDMKSKERIELLKDVKDWIEQIQVGFNNSELQLSQSDKDVETLRKQRKKRMPNNINYEAKSEEVVAEVSMSVDEVSKEMETLDDVNSTEDVMSLDDIDKEIEAIDTGSDIDKEIEAIDVSSKPTQKEIEQLTIDEIDNEISNPAFTNKREKKGVKQAPDKMLSHLEKQLKKEQQGEEKLTDTLERVSKEVDWSKPVDLIKGLETLLDEKLGKEQSLLIGLITGIAPYLDYPKMVVGSETKYDDETNTFSVFFEQDMFNKLAREMIQLFIKDTVSELGTFDKSDLDKAKQDYDINPTDETKEIVNLFEKYYRVQKNLGFINKQIMDNSLSNATQFKLLDKKTKGIISNLINNPELLLSVGLSNDSVVAYLQSIKVKVKGHKSRSNLYRYLLDTVKGFFGFGLQETNLLDVLLQTLGDIGEINLDVDSRLVKSSESISALTVSEAYLQAELDTPYGERNEFVVSFKQGKGSHISKYDNLIEQLKMNGLVTATRLLKEQPTTNQLDALKDFLDFRDEFIPYIKSAYVSSNKGFEHKDFKSYLYDEQTTTLDDDVATALALSAYTWIQSNGNKVVNTYDDVKSLLNVDDDTNVVIPSGIYKQYKHVGFLLPSMANELGTNFTKALDIQETDFGKLGALSELQMSVGGWLISAMQIAGLVHTSSIPSATHQENIKEVGGNILGFELTPDFGKVNFVAVIDKDGNANIRIDEIIETNKGTSGFVNRVFGVDIGLRNPVFKKPEKIKRKIKGSKSLVSDLQATFINKMQQEAIEIDVSMFNAVDTLLTQFGDRFTNMIGASITDEQLSKLHKNDRESKESKAVGLKRELDLALGFISGLKKTDKGFQKFYDTIYVAKNNRMHFNSNVFNMQTSIIQRMLASYENFKTEIDLSDVSLDNLVERSMNKNKPTAIGLFLRAMGANLEGTEKFVEAFLKEQNKTFKAYTVDKLDSPTFIPAFVAWLKTDDVQASIKAMQNVLANKATDKDMEQIEWFVDTGDMGIQSLRALVELARFQSSLGQSFTTSIGLGSDGVNNGIAIGHIYNGIGDVKTLIQLGFISKNNQWGITDYFSSRYVSEIGDYYEAFSQVFSKVMQGFKEQNENLKSLLEAIEYIQPKLYQRGFAKNIVIPFGYNAGINRLVQVASEAFVSDIQSMLAKLANNPNDEKHADLESHLKKFLGDEYVLPKDDLLEYWFDNKQLKQLMDTYNNLMKESISNALDIFAGEFAQRRNQNVSMQEHTFNMFYDSYQIIVQQAVNTLMEEQRLTRDEFLKRGFMKNEWERLVEEPLKKLMPRVMTAFTTTQGDIQINPEIEHIDSSLTGIEVFRRATKYVPAKQESKTNRRNDKDELNPITVLLPAKEKMFESVGVFVNSAQIQGTDGRISAEVSAMLDGHVNLNIHDQNDSGLGNYKSMVDKQNQVTFDVLATNHIQLNTLETFTETLHNYQSLYEQGLITIAEYQYRLSYVSYRLTGLVDFKKGLGKLATNVYGIERDKLNTMSNLYSTHQYAGETGEHITNDKDLELINKQGFEVVNRIGLVKDSLDNLPDYLIPDLVLKFKRLHGKFPVTFEKGEKGQFVDGRKGKEDNQNILTASAGKYGWLGNPFQPFTDDKDSNLTPALALERYIQELTYRILNDDKFAVAFINMAKTSKPVLGTWTRIGSDSTAYVLSYVLGLAHETGNVQAFREKITSILERDVITTITTENGNTHEIDSSLLDKPFTLKDGLDRLVKSADDYSRKLIEYYAGLIPDAKIEIIRSVDVLPKGLKTRANSGGVYNPKTETTYIYPDSNEWEFSFIELVNHELTHRVTVGVVGFDGMPSRLTDEQKNQEESIIIQLQDILSNNDNLSAYIQDRISNTTLVDTPHELVAILTAETQVRQAIKSINPDVIRQFDSYVKSIVQVVENDNLHKRRDIENGTGLLQGEVSDIDSGTATGTPSGANSNSTSTESRRSLESNQTNPPFNIQEEKRLNQVDNVVENEQEQRADTSRLQAVHNPTLSTDNKGNQTSVTSSQDNAGNNGSNETNNTFNGNQTEQLELNQAGNNKSTSELIAKLLDKPFTLVSGLDDLVAIGQDTYSIELVKRIAQLNPDVSIEIVSDISRLDRRTQSDVLGGGMYYPKDNKIIINPHTQDWQASLLELINHELVHSITVGIVGFNDTPRQLSKEQDERFEALNWIIKEANWLSGNDIENNYLFSRLDYATTQAFPNELLSVYLAELNARQFIKDALGDKVTDLDNLIREIIYASTQSRTNVRSKQERQVDDVSEIFNSGTTADVSSVTQSNSTSQDTQRVVSVSEANDVVSISEQKGVTENEQITNGSIGINQTGSIADVQRTDTRATGINGNSQTSVSVSETEQSQLGLIGIKSNNSGLVHQLPSNLLNKTMLASRFVKEIIGINSGLLSKAELDYSNGLLNIILNVNKFSDSYIYIASSLQEINRLANESGEGITWVAYSQEDSDFNNTIYVNVHNGINEDLKKIVTHEFIHEATIKGIVFVQDKKDHEINYDLRVAYNTLKNWFVDNQDFIDAYSKSGISYALNNAKELMAVGLSQKEVIQHLIDIPFKESNLYQEIVRIGINLMKISYGSNSITSDMENEIYVLSRRFEDDIRRDREHHQTVRLSDTRAGSTGTQSSELASTSSNGQVGRDSGQRQTDDILNDTTIQPRDDAGTERTSGRDVTGKSDEQTLSTISQNGQGLGVEKSTTPNNGRDIQGSTTGLSVSTSIQEVIQPSRVNNPKAFIEKLLNHVSDADKSQVELINFLLPKLVHSSGLQFEWVDGLSYQGEIAYGLYLPDTNTIQLNTQTWNGLSSFSKVALVLHESIHALTEQSIKNPNKQQQEAINALEQLRKQLKAKTKNKDMLARLKNINEFIAYGLTDKSLIHFMVEHGSLDKSSKVANGLGKFFSSVMKLFGWAKDDKRTDTYKTFVNLSMKLVQSVDKPTSGSPRASVDVVADITTQADVLQGNPVAEIIDEKSVGMPSSGGFKAIQSWATGIFDSQGNKAVNAVLGDVELHEQSVRSSLAHGKLSFHKNLAFVSVKDVIEKGVIIAKDSNGKEDSFYVSAPILLKGERVIQTILIHRDVNTQRMYIHSVMLEKNLLTPRVSEAPTDVGKQNSSLMSKGNQSDKHTGMLTSTDIRNILQSALTFNSPRASILSADDVVNEKSTLDVLKDMPTSSSNAFNEHLDSLIDKTIGQFYQRDNRMVERAMRKNTNDNTIALFGLDDKQAHVYEVLKVVLSEYIDSQAGTLTVNDIRKAYQETKAQLSYEVFLSDNPTELEVKLAKKAYDKVFGSQTGKDYLANFMALALSSEMFNQVLDRKRVAIKRDINRPLFDRLMRLFDSVVAFLTGLYTHKTGHVNKQLLNMSKRLQQVDENARSYQASVLQTTWDMVGKGFTPINTLLHKSVQGVIGQLASRNFPVGAVTQLNLIADKLKGTNVTKGELFSEYLVGDKVVRFGEFKNLVNETLNDSSMTRVMERMIRYTQKVAQTRQQIKSALKRTMVGHFKSKDLSERERVALTNVVMRSDLGGLLQHFNMGQVLALATDESKRHKRIQALEQRILKHDMGNDMLMQAKALSAYMTHGVTPKHLVKSSEAIALQVGLEVNDISKLDRELYKAIDSLVSLYALNNLSDDTHVTFSQLVLDERKGVEFVVRQHASAVVKSKAEFKDNPLSYSKGYTPDILNPYRSLQWVDKNDVDSLVNQGWEVITEDLIQDEQDLTEQRVLMFHRDINYQRRVSGALDLSDTHSRGTVVYNQFDYTDLQRVAKARQDERLQRNQELSFVDYNPFKETGGLVLNTSSDGFIVDFHYEMQGFVKDKLLERNNDIFDLLPTMVSSLEFKPDIKSQRSELSRILFSDYKANYHKNPKLFVVIDPESADPKVQEDYALMPYEFRQALKKQFGNNPIVVRSSVYNSVFGYKAWSVGKSFDKTFDEQNVLEKLFTGLFGWVFDGQAQSKAVQFERVVQFITGMAKDVIVIRSGKVLLGNIFANLLLLGMNGVRPDVIVKDTLFAWREGQRYSKLQNRLIEIEFELKSAKGDKRKVLNQEKHELKVDMDKHPMRDYMNAGMMSTIVEDTVIFKDKPDYVSIWEEKINIVTDKIPKPVKDTFDWLLINPNTPIYDFLADATQFSDFSAKYVLAKHLQSKGMSFNQAISEAQESFINYDVPTGQGLDYMNRMGLFMFTKFFLRFQKVLAKRFKEKPAQMITQHLLLENGLDMAGIADPAMVLRIGNNPFEASAFSIVGTGDDLLTYQLISATF